VGARFRCRPTPIVFLFWVSAIPHQSPFWLGSGLLTLGLADRLWVSSKHSSVSAASVHELAWPYSGLLIRMHVAMRHPSLAQAAGGLDDKRVGSDDDVHSDLVVVGQPLGRAHRRRARNYPKAGERGQVLNLESVLSVA
jgi:hypothetical protein